MVCLNTGSRLRVPQSMWSAIAALPVLALAQFAFIAPASAHHVHHYRHHGHAARSVAHAHAAWTMAAGGGFYRPAEAFSGSRYGNPGFYDYAPDRYTPAYQAQSGWRTRAPRSAFNGGGYRQNAFGSFNTAPVYDRGASPEIDGNINGNINGMAASAASSAGIPASLVARVIKRESGGNPRAVSKGNYGLMQIRLGTARAMGYSGSAEGLLDPHTNMTYAVKYLAGAYRAAGGNEDRAVALYARGYYGVAKAQGFSPQGFSPYATAQSDVHYASYQHVADAGFGNSGFASGPQFGGQNYDGDVRVRHHRRRGV